MGNIMDYISWRGDLSFEQSQFNEVDNLILACFSYVNLDDKTEGNRTEKADERIYETSYDERTGGG